MILRIDARGPGSDQISYKIGNHPGRQLIRRESEALGRLWFPEYEEEKCSVILHVRSNIPPIPNRLTSSSIRYREWHRFAEWVNSFLGKVLREPDPAAQQQEELEYRIKVGVLPNPVHYDDELVDLFERADFSVEEPSGSTSSLERWLRLRVTDLSFSELLCRLSVLVPSLFGRYRSGLETEGYARLLDNLRGTWFNVHPKKDFLINRFLALRESSSEGNDDGLPVQLGEDHGRFKQMRELFDQVGQKISDLIEIPWTSQEQEFWILNARDGMLLPGVDDLIEEFTTHLVEGHQKELERSRQRVKQLSIDDELSAEIDEEQFHWCPAGFQNTELSDANIILWSPVASELNEDMIPEVAHEMLSVHGPERLIVWSFTDGRSLIAPGSVLKEQGQALSKMNRSNWTSAWEQKAEAEGYSCQWESLNDLSVPGNVNGVHIGRFTG